jgi:hypothetical protein
VWVPEDEPDVTEREWLEGLRPEDAAEVEAMEHLVEMRDALPVPQDDEPVILDDE